MEENNQEINQEMPTAKKNNGSALGSFIVSIVGLIIAGIPCGIAAVILGILGLTKFNPATEKNKWMAIFGIILGAIDVILVIVALPSLLSNLGL